MQITEEILVH